MRILLVFFLFFPSIGVTELIGPPMITGTVHKFTSDRVIIRIPSGEETREYRVHIDRSWLPAEYKKLKVNQDISFVRTVEMVKKNAIIQLNWRLQ